MTDLTPWNYTDLDAETRIVVMQRTTEIKALMKRAAQDILDIGQKLIEVKARLGHGRFGDWLKIEFAWSQDTAERFMAVSKRIGQIPHGAEFDAKALYLLAAPSTPDEAREEALERASSGERITHQTAQAIVGQHRRPEPIKAAPMQPIDLGDEDWGGAEDPYGGVQVQTPSSQTYQSSQPRSERPRYDQPQQPRPQYDQRPRYQDTQRPGPTWIPPVAPQPTPPTPPAASTAPSEQHELVAVVPKPVISPADDSTGDIYIHYQGQFDDVQIALESAHLLPRAILERIKVEIDQLLA